MTVRKCVIALTVAALLAVSVKPSKAVFLTPAESAPAATTVGAGVYITGGFIGVVAVLCLYDIWLKIDGQKNWDGTPKIRGRH